MSGEEKLIDWRTFGRVEWLFVTGLALMVLVGGFFAFRYVSKAEPPPLPALTATARTKPIAQGFIVSASDDRIVIETAKGDRRSFGVRPEDLPNVGVPYLAAHQGDELSGFLIYYDSQGGTDYAMGAVETGPLPLSGTP